MSRERYRKSPALSAESATPAASTSRMACFMASHACLARAQPLPLLRRVALLPSPTPIAQTGTVSTIDSLSPHLIGGLLEVELSASRPAREHMTSGIKVCASLIDADPCCQHPSRPYAHPHAERKNAAVRRSVLPTSRGRCFESPSPMGTFSHHGGCNRSILAATGLVWTWPAPADCMCSRLGRHGDAL